jgi:hypothetical protein
MSGEPDTLTAAELAVAKLRAALAAAEGDAVAEGELVVVAARLEGPEGAYRQRLQELFVLSPAEMDALDMAVAVAAEPSLGPPLAALQGFPDRRLPSEIALRLLFGHGPAPVVRGASALLAWGLVVPVVFAADEPGFFRADPAVVDWYFGLLSASAIPLRRVREVPPLDEWRVEDHARRIAAILARGHCVRVQIAGKRGSGRASLADGIARALGKQALAVEAETVAEDAGHGIFQRLQRLALLGDLALIWRGTPAHWPAALPSAPLHFVTNGEDDARLAPIDGLIDLRIAMPDLGVASQAALARNYLPELADTLDAGIGQPLVGDLADAAAQNIASLGELRAFLSQRNRSRVGQIGRIARGDVRWDDLVLPERTLTMLRAFADEAQARAALLADPERRRVFADTAHLSALFAGPPGLGKSMSARVVANTLGLDLLIVDLSAVTSKYIGETSKNLTAAFDVAREAQCALMFEEADSLFTTRVKVENSNDRHSNADTGHLLQLMESHEGVVMLSSNRRGNIDAAFTRRLRYVFEFRKPELAQRELLWRRMLGLLGMEGKSLDEFVPVIAAAHELSPAQIKGAALTAAYRAGIGKPIAPGHVEEGVRLEFMKEGRLISALAEPDGRRPAHG